MLKTWPKYEGVSRSLIKDLKLDFRKIKLRIQNSEKFFVQLEDLAIGIFKIADFKYKMVDSIWRVKFVKCFISHEVCIQQELNQSNESNKNNS